MQNYAFQRLRMYYQWKTILKFKDLWESENTGETFVIAVSCSASYTDLPASPCTPNWRLPRCPSLEEATWPSSSLLFSMLFLSLTRDSKRSWCCCFYRWVASSPSPSRGESPKIHAANQWFAFAGPACICRERSRRRRGEEELEDGYVKKVKK